MKKLKDLKENECIKVNTLKEYKTLCGYIFSGIPAVYPIYVSKGVGFWWTQEIPKGKIALPASEFIKPKKSTKKIIKELKEEVARLDNEVFDIKKMLPDAVVNVEVEKKNSLELGRWYKNIYYGILCFKNTDEFGYGIINGDWHEEIDCTSICEWKPAAHKEVEEALINEAKKRGFKECVQIKVNGGIETLDEYKGCFMLNGNALWYGGYMIFNNGEWKEIVSQPEQEEEIDWSVAGQIVEGTYTTAITTGRHDNSDFQAFVIKTTDGSKVNHLCSTLLKEYFSLVKGGITLKND